MSLTFRDRAGNTSTFTYDNRGNVKSRTLSGEPTRTWTYNLADQVTQVDYGSIWDKVGYDALGRVTSEQSYYYGTVTHSYAANGLLSRTTYPQSGLYIDYSYFGSGALRYIKENGASSGVGLLASYTYDRHGRPKYIDFGNGTRQTFSFDDVDQLSQLAHDLPGTSNDLTQSFTYNTAGQIASMTRSNDAYTYDQQVNVERAYTNNGLNQTTASGSDALTWDANGNLATWGSDSYTFTKDSFLKTTPSGKTLYYDAMGRLRKIYESGQPDTGFNYSGLNLIGEYDGNNNLLRRYVHGPGIDNPIVWYEGTGTFDRRFLLSDERGSVIAVTNSSRGPILANTYDELGTNMLTDNASRCSGMISRR